MSKAQQQSQAKTEAFEQAIKTAESGDKGTARQMFAEIVRAEPENEAAWIWLARCAKTESEQRRYLERVLQINPVNFEAQEILEKLNRAEPEAAPSPGKQKKQQKQGLSSCTTIFILAVGALLVWYLFFYDSGSGSSSSSSGGGYQRQSTSSSYSIKYEVGGNGTNRASLTYENQSSNTEQKSDAALPWSKSFTAESSQFLYVSAQNEKDSGTIWCKIYQDGKVIEQAESAGAYVIATCSGSAGD